MYRDGRGVAQDRQEALSLLKRKCVKKNANASFMHACMLLDDAADAATTAEATRLLKVAAKKQDHADEQ